MENQRNNWKRKSFVLRKGRITFAQKRAIKYLWKEYGIEYTPKLLKLESIFKDLAQTGLDIGFGSGESLIHMAENNTNIGLLGVEVYPPGIGIALNRAKQKGIKNIRIINGDVELVLQHCLMDKSLDFILVFYPDPWPKKRHHKRRLLNSDFLNLALRKLKTGGLLYGKTDSEDYFRFIEKEISLCKGWKKLCTTELPMNFLKLPSSSYENKALKKANETKSFIYKKI